MLLLFVQKQTGQLQSRLKFCMTVDMDINDLSVALYTVPFLAMEDEDGATYLGALVRVNVAVLPPNLPLLDHDPLWPPALSFFHII